MDLLLPVDQELEGVGPHDGSRVRGLRVLQFMPIQIQKALQKKERAKRNGRDGSQGGVPDLARQDMQVFAIW